jgi:hypothetical protein
MRRPDLVARVVAVAAGIWLMAAPAVLGYTDTTAADNDRIVGPIAGALAFVACWQVVSALRWATVPLGAWLVLAPDVRDQFGGGWRTVRPSAWRSDVGADAVR